MLAYANSGLAAAEGLIIGAAAGAVYLMLLHSDVDRAGVRGAGTPLDLLNPLRVLRLLVPLLLVPILGLVGAATSSGGLEQWLAGIRWTPGSNFDGVVQGPTLYGGLLGYVLAVLALQVRGLVAALPEAKDLLQALPGSAGVAARLAQDNKQGKQDPAAPPKKAAKAIPVLLVSGPRGCGKSTLVKRLRAADPRFREPQWVTTADSGPGAGFQLISEEEFDTISSAGGLAVSYRPYGDDGEQISVGLSAFSVLAAAEEGGACILDVDPPTARMLLGYRWDRALSAWSKDQPVELRFVAVWVSLSSLDAVVERNRQRLMALQPRGGAVLDRQLALLRAQVTSDIEWAVTSGRFDFTILNEDAEAAAAELQKDAQYCFNDPF